MTARTEALPKVREQVLKSLKAMDRAVEEYSSQVEQVLWAITVQCKKKVAELYESKAELSRDTERALEEIERTLVEDRPTLRSKYGPSFRLQLENFSPFELFSYSIQTTQLAQFVTIRKSIGFTEISHTQQAFRSYLVRKHVAALQANMLNLGVETQTEPEDSIDFLTESVSLHMTDAVRATYSRLNPLVLEKKVVGVVNWRPRKLTKSGDVYIGQWTLGRDGVPFRRKGQGKLVTASGELMEGYWRNGRLHLTGRIILANGDYYEGAFADGVRQGIGVEVSQSGERFEGVFQGGERNGQGKLILANYLLEGTFVNGKLEYGKKFIRDGGVYEGQLKDMEFCGKGKFTYADGKTYEGDYLHNKKNGYGVYKWEGKVYEGPWVDGKMHGQGWLTNEFGRKKYEFRNGMRGDVVRD